MNGQIVDDLPTYYLPLDRQRLAKNNLADMGQIAHRRDLHQARFDENLDEAGDWNLLARLTREKASGQYVAPAFSAYDALGDYLYPRLQWSALHSPVYRKRASSDL